ncbi:MAG: transcriptional regulator [Pirellulales bacterium]
MSHAARSTQTAIEQLLPADIADLAAALAELPPDQRQRIEPLLARVLESSKRRRRILGLVQDALTQLRLDMKYLMFDLEATRRERDEFRRKVEEA